LPSPQPQAVTPVQPPVNPPPPQEKPPSSQAAPAKPVSWEQVANYIGQYAAVYGPVMSTNYAVRSNGQPTFLNIGRPYPQQGFTVVIWGSDRKAFPYAPESHLKNRTIQVTGLVEEYRGVPEIIARSAGQIEIR
jgi:DNA/RNA endonuclease YhcR with UshA esterase domain